MNANELRNHLIHHHQNCPFHKTANNFLTKYLSPLGIKHPSIYPKKGPLVPHIKEADALQTTRLNVLLNMLIDHPQEFNENGERVKFDGLMIDHGTEIGPTRKH